MTFCLYLKVRKRAKTNLRMDSDIEKSFGLHTIYSQSTETLISKSFENLTT